MKICDVCGTLNLKDNIYCTHCGCKILEENICPFCGAKNPDANDFCQNCHKQITPIAIDSFDVLFSDYNFSLILNPRISENDYDLILERIFKKLDYFSITGNTPKEKVLQIANVFTYVVPKSSGVAYGEFGSPVVLYDDRLDDSFQISTIIHELAHFLLFDITVNILCEIFDVMESPVIKAFADYFLTLPEITLINEFCAHTVENRFIPWEFQNFASFNQALVNSGMDVGEAMDFIELGYSFAMDIIGNLEIYIDENLRESIKLQFKRDLLFAKSNEYVEYTKKVLEFDEKNQMFVGLMAIIFNDLYNNKEARKELEYNKLKFEF